MNQHITSRRIYDKDGAFTHVEILQGPNVIKLKVRTALDRPESYFWDVLKNTIDNHFLKARVEATEQNNE